MLLDFTMTPPICRSSNRSKYAVRRETKTRVSRIRVTVERKRGTSGTIHMQISGRSRVLNAAKADITVRLPSSNRCLAGSSR